MMSIRIRHTSATLSLAIAALASSLCNFGLVSVVCAQIMDSVANYGVVRNLHPSLLLAITESGDEATANYDRF